MTKNPQLHIYVDGRRSEYGLATWGMVIIIGKMTFSADAFVGEYRVNLNSEYAELMAITEGIQEAKEYPGCIVTVFNDCQGLIRQINRDTAKATSKPPLMREMIQRVKSMLAEANGHIYLQWVNRQNTHIKKADSLSRGISVQCG